MGIVNTADCIIIVVESIQDIEKIKSLLSKSYGKQIIAINKIDTLSNEQLRKFQETIKSKRIPGILISAESGVGVEELKERIFQNMNSIRVYTKEPGKSPSPNPVVLRVGSTVKDIAESIRNGFSKTVKESRITGPSSKFPNQKVGLEHILKDKDIVEFKTF
jgi:ribosome-interacting GTPase 1